MDQPHIQDVIPGRSDGKAVYYECQCGKMYSAFPALYLHCKRNHSIKISKYFGFSDFIVQENTESTKFIYLYSRIQKTKAEQKKTKKRWKNLMAEYTKKEQEKERESGQDIEFMDCFDNLGRYIKGRGKKGIKQSEQELCSELSYHLNYFMKEMVSEISKEKFDAWSRILIDFSRWQFDQKHSKVILQRNSDFRF